MPAPPRSLRQIGKGAEEAYAAVRITFLTCVGNIDHADGL
jgi:hypothetical protein